MTPIRKRGRPKGADKVPLNLLVLPKTFDKLCELARRLSLPMGAALDQLLARKPELSLQNNCNNQSYPYTKGQ